MFLFLLAYSLEGRRGRLLLRRGTVGLCRVDTAEGGSAKRGALDRACVSVLGVFTVRGAGSEQGRHRRRRAVPLAEDIEDPPRSTWRSVR